MDWIDLAKDRNRSRELVNTVMKFQFPWKKDSARWRYLGNSKDPRLLQYCPVSEFRRRLLDFCYDKNFFKIRGPLPAAKFLGTEFNFPCWNACFRYSFCPAWQHLSWPSPSRKTPFPLSSKTAKSMETARIRTGQLYCICLRHAQNGQADRQGSV